MRRPDFIVAGTQKAGTTWLREHLFRHPALSGVASQIHFFDRHYEKGLEWYCSHFDRLPQSLLVGEKSTEYFDTATSAMVAERIARDCPEARVIVVLREPVARAFSALQHTVTMGREPLPRDPDALLFADRDRRTEDGFRYIERGFYARQIDDFLRFIPKERLLILIFEEDIMADPKAGLAKAFSFLGVDPAAVRADRQPVNTRRLSRFGIRLMNELCAVPYARSIIWRIDTRLPLIRWRPVFSDATRATLKALYAPENERLFEILGRRIKSWE